jgi:hypothetical protein
MPYGFVDQELSSPIRFPSPAGDYCFIYDCENREPGDARTTRMVDAEYFHAGLAHPWTVFGVDRAAAAMSDMGSDRPSTNLYDPSWLTDQVRQWRVMVESVFGDGVPGTPPSPKGPRSAKSDGARATGVPGLKCIVARHGGSKFDLNDWEVAEPW